MLNPNPIHKTFSYLEALNPPQREAVEAQDGAVLVLAGAGTGKTKVLTTRLAHLLATNRAYPSQILAVTFTNKAALEMKKRVEAVLGGTTDNPVSTDGWWLGTFHALAARMLRRHAERAGLKNNFSILDEDDQLRLLRQLLEVENIDVKKNPPRLLMSVIQRWKDRGLTPDALGQAEGRDLADGKLAQIYAAYQERLKILNACDFGDLMLHMLAIFRAPENRDVLEAYQERFRYILVDEYQDTNTVQYLWLRLLAQKHRNICCVGDDDQSIYGWRGAEIGNILKFEHDFPGARVIRLEQNYRSTQHILSAANGVISYNKGRLGKTLWSGAGEGQKVILRGVWDGMQEAESVARDVEQLRRQGVPLREIAVLVRAGHQTRAFEERFLREGLPYRVVGGLRFYERQEIRDAIAYLRVVVQPDDDLAFERIINLPKRGVGDSSLQMLHRLARARGISLFAALQSLLETEELRPKLRETLRTLLRDFERWRGLLREIPHPELARAVLDESGYTAMWQADKSPEAAGRLENLREFVNAMGEFESMDAFLEHVALVMENNEKEGVDMVSVMTLHSAKGLEFDAVFLPGWEEGLFPSQRAMDESGQSGLEEERRLAYVGITRAKKRACILFAANRLIYGSWTSCLPSRFLDELPKDHVEAAGETGTYRPVHAGAAPALPRRSFLAEVEIPSTAPHLESEAGFGPGDRVFHEKFGYGTVLATENDKLDIRFDKAGRKKVVDSFVRKEK